MIVLCVVNIIIDKRKVNIENIVVVEKKIVKTLIVCCVTDKRSVSSWGVIKYKRRM